MGEAERLWSACADALREQVKDGVWLSTFQDITATELTESGLLLQAPSGLVRDRLEGRYSSLIRGVMDESGGEGIAIIIDVDDTIDLRGNEGRLVPQASTPAPAPKTAPSEFPVSTVNGNGWRTSTVSFTCSPANPVPASRW